MEISGAAALTVFLFVVSLLILVSSLRSNSSSKKRRPPGPWAFLLVGSLHHMLTSQPQAALRDLAAKYGPVMLLRLGQVDTVVISSPAAAQEVLQTNDISFASRPSLVATEIICYGNVDLAFSPYGHYWRAVRKLSVLELLSVRRVKQFAPIRDSETMSLVAQIRAAAAGAGGHQEEAAAAAVNLGSLLVSCAKSITGLATFGDGCNGERKEQYLSATAVVLSVTSGFCVSDLFPSLWFVDVLTGTRRRLRRAHRQLDELFDKIIDECEARWKNESAAANAGGNLLSIMLRVRDNEELGLPFGNANIKALIMDLLTAGTGTISSTAEWVMSELIRNPESMAKAQAEVRAAFNNILPQHHESHMDGLHYMRLVIKETMRLHPSVPLLLPRLCRKTCDIGGFEVTNGCRVMINAWAMARSPEYWGDDAEEFRPTRFETATTVAAAGDYKGTTEFRYLPFGAGRRMCPGTAFGLAALELVVARLLYYFDWSLPGKMRPEELDMETVVTATAKRRNQLRLVATPYDVPVQS